MTRISFHTNAEGALTELALQGHADFAESGKDILCAGISTLTNFLLRALYTYRRGAYSLRMDPETADLVINFDPPIQLGPVPHDPTSPGLEPEERDEGQASSGSTSFPLGAFLDLWEGEVRAMASEYPDYLSVEPAKDLDGSDVDGLEKEEK